MKTIITLFCLLITFSYAYTKQDQIKMTEISALTFVRGEQTNARRTSSIPQLECVSGSARYDSSVQPETVQCVNVGNDGKNVQWKCEGNLDNKVKFGKLVVSCEGYSHKDDPYVLVGSCGLRYGLEYENGAKQSTKTQHQQRQYYDNTQYDSGSSWASTIFDFVFYGLVIAFIYYAISYFSMRNNPAYAGNMPGYGPQAGLGVGQGYGGGANYGPQGYQNPLGPSSTYGAYPSTGYGSYGGYPSSTGGGWWSGFATGGLLGSLWNRPTTNYGYRSSGYSSPSSNRSFGGSSFSSGSSGSSSRRSTGHATSETR